MPKHILLTECPDSPGLITAITGICSRHHINILKNTEYVDTDSRHFFMRSVFDIEDGSAFDKEAFLEDLDKTLPKNASRRFISKLRKRVVIMVTKEGHCLGDILIKNYNGALDIEIAAVIGNHQSLRNLVEKFNIPFHCISHENVSREEHEAEVLNQLTAYSPDYLVLAKYMRILSEKFVSLYPNRIINIHHSFLPAFIGAKPYKQAFDRGVKIIGATAHFVSNDLDEGPIIHQGVIHVDHTYTPTDMAKAGQEVEESVLLKAVRDVTKERVFIKGNKTVIFN